MNADSNHGIVATDARYRAVAEYICVYWPFIVSPRKHT